MNNDRPYCFVATPFRSHDPTVVEKNLAFALEICRRIALETSLEPRAPHLYFPRFLRDEDPVERAIGIGYMENTLRFSEGALFAVPTWYTALSAGMREELKAAQRHPRCVTTVAHGDAALELFLVDLARAFPKVKAPCLKPLFQSSY